MITNTKKPTIKAIGPQISTVAAAPLIASWTPLLASLLARDTRVRLSSKIIIPDSPNGGATGFDPVQN